MATRKAGRRGSANDVKPVVVDTLYDESSVVMGMRMAPTPPGFRPSSLRREKGRTTGRTSGGGDDAPSREASSSHVATGSASFEMLAVTSTRMFAKVKSDRRSSSNQDTTVSGSVSRSFLSRFR